MFCFVFYNFGMARVASQRLFFREKNMFLHFVRPDSRFSTFLRIKTNSHWNFAKICPIFSPWTPIWDHFVHLWMIPYQNNPRLSWSLQISRYIQITRRRRPSPAQPETHYDHQVLWPHVPVSKKHECFGVLQNLRNIISNFNQIYWIMHQKVSNYTK